MLDSDGTNGKHSLKPIIYFHSWRVGKVWSYGDLFISGVSNLVWLLIFSLKFVALSAGVVIFILGNCLNFISFGYAAQVSIDAILSFSQLCDMNRLSGVRCFWISNLQVRLLWDWTTSLLWSKTCFFLFNLPLLDLQSLLAALGSVQFVSNIAFAYFVFNKTVTVKYVNIWHDLIFGAITKSVCVYHFPRCYVKFFKIVPHVSSISGFWLQQPLLFLETFFLLLLAITNHLVSKLLLTVFISNCY